VTLLKRFEKRDEFVGSPPSWTVDSLYISVCPTAFDLHRTTPQKKAFYLMQHINVALERPRPNDLAKLI
jgi:hypothetical protein